ncbi:MAG: heme oxygenase (biliverdin-producing) [Thermocrispum sp.]
MTAAPPSTERVPFSQQLREATREAHVRAESSDFVARLLDGSAGLAGFTALAVQHFHIYTALESAARRLSADPVAGRFVLDGLVRVPPLSVDLRFLLGPEWEAAALPNQATAEYCSRINEVSADWPGGFVAHHYTRYLGDISGGQVIRSRLRTHYGITGDGARFYDFSALGSPAAFRRRYRGLLDSAGWDEAERARIVAEAQLAFDHNAAVFADLGLAHGR